MFAQGITSTQREATASTRPIVGGAGGNVKAPQAENVVVVVVVVVLRLVVEAVVAIVVIRVEIVGVGLVDAVGVVESK